MKKHHPVRPRYNHHFTRLEQFLMSRAGATNLFQDLSTQLAENVKHFPDFVKELLHDLLLPALYTLLSLYILVLVYNTAAKRLRPLSAHEMHQKALKLLQSTRQTPNPNSDAQAVALLWQAMDADVDYIPAIQSLAAYYIYRQANAAVAVKVLGLASASTKSNHFDRLRADAQALATGNASMIQADLGEDEYLSLKTV